MLAVLLFQVTPQQAKNFRDVYYMSEFYSIYVYRAEMVCRLKAFSTCTNPVIQSVTDFKNFVVYLSCI